MRLSDAFEHQTAEPDLELRCKVYNINPGYNTELLGRYSVLTEYTAFVECVWFYSVQYPLDEALDRAIDRCLDDHIMEEFLRTRRGEVKRAMTLDYTFERRLQLARQENQEIIEQLKEEKEQLTEEKEQWSEERGQLVVELSRMRKLLEENGIDPESIRA